MHEPNNLTKTLNVSTERRKHLLESHFEILYVLQQKLYLLLFMLSFIFRKDCNGTWYDIQEATSCENKLYPGASLSCCGNEPYNPETATCCKVQHEHDIIGNAFVN